MEIEATTLLTWGSWAIAALLTVVVWFIRREIIDNRAAHAALDKRINSVENGISDIKLVVGRIEGLIMGANRPPGQLPPANR